MSDSKVIIVTGASRGIGRAAARYLVSHNHKVAVVARSKEALDALKQHEADCVLPIVADMADANLNYDEDIVKPVLKKWERVDGLIINHGTLEPVTRIAKSALQEWEASFRVNLFSGVALCQAAIDPLRETKGKIIFTSSGAAYNAYPAWGAYGAAKAALNHLVRTLSKEEKAIVSLAIRPGVVDTQMQHEIREKHARQMDASDVLRFRSLQENGELLAPEKPGNVIARLVIGAHSSLSGRSLSWDDEALVDFQ